MKIRKTETNIKRIERQKKTVGFVLFQIIVISLFCVFGIAWTTRATEDNTTVVTAIVEDYKYHELRRTNFRYKIFIEGKGYRTTSNFVTVNNEEFIEILSKSPLVSIRFDGRDNIVQMYSNGIEYVSFDKYNSEQTMWRIIAIVVFSIVELFACAEYVLYIMYNRTSKDKKWL